MAAAVAFGALPLPAANVALAAQGACWRVDSATVAFEVRNAGLPVRGSFDHLDARVCFDPLAPESGSLSGTIDPATIRTGIALRDRHLQRRGWFEVAKYGSIEMRSVRLRKRGDAFVGAFLVRIRDVEREVEIPFAFERRGERARIGGTVTIDRLRWGLGKPSIVLADYVTVEVGLALARDGPEQDTAAIRRVAVAWDEAWNRGDVAAVASLLSEDVDFVSRSGAHVVGRAAFERTLTAAFASRYRGSRRTTTGTLVTLLGPDVALMRVDWTIANVRGPDGGTVDPQDGTLLLVLERTSTGWSVVAGQNTNVPRR